MEKKSNFLVNKKEVFTRINYLTLIGEFIEILSSKNFCEIGLKGVLVDESESFFYLRVGSDDVKMLRKSNLVFKIEIGSKDLKINGELLNKTIIHRIKKIKRC